MNQNFLFENRREIFAFLALCLAVFIINLGVKFYEFKEFQSNKHLVLKVLVTQNYTKNDAKNKTYRVLKLKTDKFSFYTTAKPNFNPEIGSEILIRPLQKNVKFIGFLSQNFYMPNFGLLELRYEQNGDESIRSKIYHFIANQHDLPKLKELFTALFLATPISKELRDDVNHFAIAHLIAISGYHLGLIFASLYFCLKFPYRHFQAKFFPYRNEKFDLSIAIFAVLFGYLVLIDFVPSFLRAFLMSVVIFFLLTRNIRILNFEILFCVAVLAISFMPNLAFSVGFYFSCVGVFFIYLYLHHFRAKFSNKTHIILLNLWVYLGMIIPVLYFFPLISFQQLSVLVLSFAFVIFYPLMTILHIFEYGGLFDEALYNFLNFRLASINLHINFWLFLAYNISALISIKSRNLAIFLVGCNLLCFLALL